MRFMPLHHDSGGTRLKRRVAGWMVAGTVLLGHIAGMSGATVAPEYQVKAQILVNMPSYTIWPEGTFEKTNSPVVIGILGKDPFGPFLAKAVEAGARRDRPLKLKPIGNDAEIKECHILFVASSERRRLKDLKQRWKGAPVLTVGEADDFLDNGGVIKFVLKENSVRFEISVESAKAAGLGLDANLLRVADAVRGKYE